MNSGRFVTQTMVADKSRPVITFNSVAAADRYLTCRSAEGDGPTFWCHSGPSPCVSESSIARATAWARFSGARLAIWRCRKRGEIEGLMWVMRSLMRPRSALRSRLRLTAHRSIPNAMASLVRTEDNKVTGVPTAPGMASTVGGIRSPSGPSQGRHRSPRRRSTRRCRSPARAHHRSRARPRRSCRTA